MAKPNAANIAEKRGQAFKRLNIHPDKRGILTIQLLKKLEELAGIPCYALFDMVAGTSTGAIIAGLITLGHTAAEIEEKYEALVTEVFDRRIWGSRFINLPKYSKNKYRKLLEQLILAKTQKDCTLEEACRLHMIDLMITAQDISAAEETFFSCFKQDDDQDYYGTYKDVLLRTVMEATMSAPTYFNPLERFVDGGTTTYNNPSLAAFMEAVSYSRADKDIKRSAYQLSNITMFSFGTGISRMFVAADHTLNLPGVFDIVFWLNWLMTQTGQDASAMQVNMFRSPMIRHLIDFRRFEISLDLKALQKLPDAEILDETKYHTKRLKNLDEHILDTIDMADVTKFDLMQAIGQQMALFIVESGNNFQSDLVDTIKGNDLLVTSSGNISGIQQQMSSAKWLNGFPS